MLPLDAYVLYSDPLPIVRSAYAVISGRNLIEMPLLGILHPNVMPLHLWQKALILKGTITSNDQIQTLLALTVEK